MQFLRRNRYALLTVAILIFSTVLVIQQYLSNESAHTRQVEDFLLLHERGEKAPCAHLYQTLVQELPHLNNRALVQDLLRTALEVDPKTPQLDNLVWKYHVSVRNELRHRSEKRLATELQGGAKE
jgi:hypothetical protein